MPEPSEPIATPAEPEPVAETPTVATPAPGETPAPTAQLIEDTAGKTRDLPISADLRALLIGAASEVGIDTVRVTSGGQCAKGTCEKRVGSTRHDLGGAADLEIIKDGRTLSLLNFGDRETYRDFLQACAKLGATGIGAGPGYMTEFRVHVGYGSKAIWGAGGKSANAPEWVRSAVINGWQQATGGFETAAATIPESLDSDDEEAETDF
ncbi:MAG: hypothetical protein MRY64_14460 [Hyphomonadaceae bacterium]|nr:hypothetical protein [Hyphomonadaceae bacterium]